MEGRSKLTEQCKRISRNPVFLSIAGAVLASVIVQQIAYRNSMEYKIRSFFESQKAEARKQEEESQIASRASLQKQEEETRKWCEYIGTKYMQEYPEILKQLTDYVWKRGRMTEWVVRESEIVEKCLRGKRWRPPLWKREYW